MDGDSQIAPLFKMYARKGQLKRYVSRRPRAWRKIVPHLFILFFIFKFPTRKWYQNSFEHVQ
jgi:hypothetical protein